MNGFVRPLLSGNAAVLLLTSLLLLACGDETIINPPIGDLRPPVITWLAPEAGSIARDTLELRFTVTDESAIDSVKLYIDGFVRIFRVFANLPPAGEAISFPWNTLSDSDGVHLLEARAWDKAGNVGASPTLLLRVTNANPPATDHTPPRIRILSPEPGSVIRNEFELQFTVTDSSRLDSILIFVDGEIGQILAAGEDSLYIAHMNSIRWSNGRRIIEVRAYDAAGNIGISNPLGLTIDNHRVIWVPDDFETIQRAINSSVDGDTVSVRAGEYEGAIMFFDKNIVLMSEFGPEVTILSSNVAASTIIVSGGQDSTTLIRGFTLRNDFADDYACVFISGSSPKIVNNIITGGARTTGYVGATDAAILRNNLFMNLSYSCQIGYGWGDFRNNMILDCLHGFYSAAIDGQPLEADFNLFWESGQPERTETMLHWGEHNLIDVNPLFVAETLKLREQSPAKDGGVPEIRDLDGSISDIGVYGGPYAYPPPN